MRCVLLFVMLGWSLCACKTIPQTQTEPQTFQSENLPDNTLSKYGVSDYQTIWGRTPSAQRNSQRSMSIAASKRGWALIQKGDLPTAMKRMNQAWSLCPENPNALWGMAIIEYERIRRQTENTPSQTNLQKLSHAISLIDEAAALPSSQASLLNDNALLVMTRGAMKKAMSIGGSNEDFSRAERLLHQAQALDIHPLIYENMAALERYRGHPE